MKKILFFCSILTVLYCQNVEKANDLSWLVGTWERTNDKEGQQTFEYWGKVGENHEGIGYTMQGSDTIFLEKMKIKLIDGKHNFVVTGVNEGPVFFEFTQQNAGSFRCENPKNEFPTVIEYAKNGEGLKAVIYGSGEEVSFDFIRKK